MKTDGGQLKRCVIRVIQVGRITPVRHVFNNDYVVRFKVGVFEDGKDPVYYVRSVRSEDKKRTKNVYWLYIMMHLMEQLKNINYNLFDEIVFEVACEYISNGVLAGNLRGVLPPQNPRWYEWSLLRDVARSLVGSCRITYLDSESDIAIDIRKKAREKWSIPSVTI